MRIGTDAKLTTLRRGPHEERESRVRQSSKRPFWLVWPKAIAQFIGGSFVKLRISPDRSAVVALALASDEIKMHQASEEIKMHQANVLPVCALPGGLYTGPDVSKCLHMYCSLWGVPHLFKRNPCSQPVSLERKHMDLIAKGNYVVADKSDGIRYALLLCKVGEQHYSFLVDRKLDMYQIPVAASKRMFAGSIFDGELVWIKGADGANMQIFLVFDVVAYKGSADIKQENLHRRLAVIREAFDLSGHVISSPRGAARCAKEGKIICGGNAYGLSFRPKLCFPLNQLDTLLRQMETLPYPTDGLIFTSVDAPNCSGTAEHTFKLKHRHMVDLQLQAASLLLGQGGHSDTAMHRVTLESVGIDLKLSPSMVQLISQSGKEEHSAKIVECELLQVDGELHLEFIGVRTDKAHPNTVRTMLSTITNLRENIQAHELCVSQRALQSLSNLQSKHDVPPHPVCCHVATHGGAELANIVVGDVLDARFSPCQTQQN